jgi:hypothetical protein
MTTDKDADEYQVRVRTAYHEAGHTLAAHLYSIVLDLITIKPGEDSLGEVCGPWRDGFDPVNVDRSAEDEELKHYILFWGAGPMAESIFTGQPYVGDEDDHDLSQALRFSRYAYSVEDYDIQLDRLWTEIEDVLKEVSNWRVVEWLAAALIDKGELRPSEAKDIILDAISRPV